MNEISAETQLIIATIGGVIFGLAGYNAGRKRSIGGAVGALLGFFLGLIGFIVVLCFRKKEEPVEYEYYDYEQPIEPSDEPLSAADEIEHLKQQLERGAITREEFNIRKAKIFGR